MWAEIAKDMQMPWRAVEAQHWVLGSESMAERAGVTPFVSTANTGNVPPTRAPRTSTTLLPRNSSSDMALESPPIALAYGGQEARPGVSDSRSQYFPSQPSNLYAPSSGDRRIEAGTAIATVFRPSNHRRESSNSSYTGPALSNDLLRRSPGGSRSTYGVEARHDRLPPIRHHREEQQQSRTEHTSRRKVVPQTQMRNDAAPFTQQRDSSSESEESERHRRKQPGA